MVSNNFYFHPYLGKIPISTYIFQKGWFNHQPVVVSTVSWSTESVFAMTDNYSELLMGG